MHDICHYVRIEFYGDEWNYELMKVVPFLKKVVMHVSYYNFGVAVDYICKAISNTGECKLQHLIYDVSLPAIHNDFPKDIINDILKFCHVLETVTVSFPVVLRDYIEEKWINHDE